MASPEKRFAGVSRKQRVNMAARRDDVRTFRQRLSDLASTSEGTLQVFGGLGFLSIMFSWAPFVPEIILVVAVSIFLNFYRFSKKLWDLPFRVPAFLNTKDRASQYPVLDASTGKKGSGNLFLGRDEETGEEVWASTDDVNTHVLMIGTTKSGKTENLNGHVFGMLALGSGAILVDGKASVNTFNSIYNISRLLGRDADLLTMDYLTGGKDMIGPQTDRRSHTYNALSFGGSAQKSEMFISLLSDSGDIWSDRAVSFVEAVMPSLSYLSDQGMLLLNPDLLSHFVVLENLENIVHFGVFRDLHGEIIDLQEAKYAAQWQELRQRLKGADTYFDTLPGGALARPKGPWKPPGMTDEEYENWVDAWFTKHPDVKRPKGLENGVDANARQKLNEQHGYVVMQFTRALNNLSNNYGYIYGAEVGEIDFHDIVLNRRTMVVLLPALERSETNLEQLGRLTVIALKTVLGGMLNTRSEGSRREIIDGNPSNSRIPFAAILDEVGYYMVKGLSVIPAQARSLGVAMYFGTQSIDDLKKKSPEEGAAIQANTGFKYYGRLVTDKESETAKAAINTGGVAHVQVADDVKFERSVMGTGGRLKVGEGSSLQEQYQIHYDDLANQQDGEFHLIVGAKEIDDRGIKGGGQRIVRMLAFFTGHIPKIDQWRRNPFVMVLPAPKDRVVIEREAERGRRFVYERLSIVNRSDRPKEAVIARTLAAVISARATGIAVGEDGKALSLDADERRSIAAEMHRDIQVRREVEIIEGAKTGFVKAMKVRSVGFDDKHVLANLKSLSGDLINWAEREKGRRFGIDERVTPVDITRHDVAKTIGGNLDRVVRETESLEAAQ